MQKTQEAQVQSLSWDDPLEEGMTTHVFLPGKFHEQRSMWATVHGIAKESDTTVQLSTQEMPRTWQSTHVALQRMGSQIVVASTYHFWWQDLE